MVSANVNLKRLKVNMHHNIIFEPSTLNTIAFFVNYFNCIIQRCCLSKRGTIIVISNFFQFQELHVLCCFTTFGNFCRRSLLYEIITEILLLDSIGRYRLPISFQKSRYITSSISANNAHDQQTDHGSVAKL